MKKPNFDPQAVKAFFVNHIEKLVFLGMVGGLLGFAYQAFESESIAFTPAALSQASKNANDTIAETPPGKLEDVPQPPRPPVLSVSDYQLQVPLNKPVLQSLELRGIPPILPPRDLRGSAGHGALRISNIGPRGEKAERRIQGQRFVVITGVIPLADQRTLFRETYAKAIIKNAETDESPSYVHYRIERADRTGPHDTSPTFNWKALNVKVALAAAESWQGSQRSLVHTDYILRVRSQATRFDFPIPPLLDAQWGEEVAHPEIPLDAAVRAAAAELRLGIGAPVGVDGEMSDDPLAVDPDDLGGGPGGIGGYYPNAEGGDEGVMVGGFETGINVQVKLFRFFDLTVQPNRHYCYRVKPLLDNPNRGVAERHLANKGSTDWTYIPYDQLPEFQPIGWSKPSDVISVPGDARVLAGPVIASRSSYRESEADVGICFFHMPTGAEQFEKTRVTRGRLLNLPERPLAEREDATFRSAQSSVEEELVDLTSDTILVDMRGGGTLPGKTTEPGILLLLDNSGNLVVRREIADEREFQERLGVVEKRDTGRTVPGLFGDGEYDMGEDYMEEGNFRGLNP